MLKGSSYHSAVVVSKYACVCCQGKADVKHVWKHRNVGLFGGGGSSVNSAGGALTRGWVERLRAVKFISPHKTLR